MNPPAPPIQEHSSVEHLAKVFRECREEIIDEWRLQAGELLRALKLDHATLTNHVPVIVDDIIDDLTYRREGVPLEQMHGTWTGHGAQRVTDGLDVGELVAEFNLLRTAFFTVMDRHKLFLVGEAARILTRRIDDSVREAVTAFSEQQARNLKAKEAEHMAFIAHDLRTPINAIALLTEALKTARDKNDLADSDETFGLLKRNLERLSTQVTRVLEEHASGRGPDGNFQPQCRQFELWPIVQALVVDFRSVAAKDKIRVVNLVPYSLTIWADAALLSQVIQNLLENAFKHTPNGQIVINARTEAGAVSCRVQDTGAGIAAEMLPKLFQKHVTSSGRPDAGLGLAMVKQIVEAHGGTVSVESTLGVGSAFTFTIPAPPES